MALNKVRGNMYGFVTHTWNPIKGLCPHGCTYCYMNKLYKRGWLKPVPPYLDEKEFTNLGSGKFIFVGSSTDIFARDISSVWNLQVLDHAKLFENKYLFQTKNPMRVTMVLGSLNFPINSILCTTLESNRNYEMFYKNYCPPPKERARYLSVWSREKHITIEPIFDFDLIPFVEMIKTCDPEQVNIGADSGKNHLPEPSKEKVLELISELEKFTKVYQKNNLRRILGVTA
jgi:DNA repair photolyase